MTPTLLAANAAGYMPQTKIVAGALRLYSL
jgi:hypothetical protein